jgi:hypothetical protein
MFFGMSQNSIAISRQLQFPFLYSAFNDIVDQATVLNHIN